MYCNVCTTLYLVCGIQKIKCTCTLYVYCVHIIRTVHMYHTYIHVGIHMFSVEKVCVQCWFSC